MTNTAPERRTHVSEEEYLRAAILLDEEIKGNGGNVEATLATHIKKCSRSFGAVMQNAAEMMVSVDRALGVDEYERQAMRRAVLCGGVAAVAVLKAAYIPEPIDTRTLFNDVELDDFDSTDELEQRHGMAEIFRDFGWEGVRVLGKDAEDLFEGWEGRLIPDVRIQNNFRIGAGIAINSARLSFEQVLAKRHQADMLAFKQELDGAHDVDWDALFADLNKEE